MSRRHRGRSRRAHGRSDEAPRPQQGIARTAAEPAAPTQTAAEARTDGFGPVPQRDTERIGTGDPAAAVLPSATNGAQRAGCTAPQLRRFIKSRPYVPMHELRRRFGINGAEDDVTALPVDDARVYVGLPERECHLLGELVRGGEVGYELSLDPQTPIVVGVYPMRPVPRA